MPKQFEKYLLRLPKNIYRKLSAVVIKILELRLEGLDVRKMEGFSDRYRCRVGKYRIIFEKKEDFGDIIEINTRGDVY